MRILSIVLVGLLLTACGVQTAEPVEPAEPVENTPVTDFHYGQMEALEGNREVEITLTDAFGEKQAVNAKLRDGQTAVFQGDMLFDAQDLDAQAAVTTQNLWYDNTIPYVMDASPKTEREVREAMAYFKEHTNIRWIPRTDQSEYVKFVNAKKMGGCSAYIGRTGEEQPNKDVVNVVTLDWDGCGIFATLHELGHVVGLYHEHMRPDRNEYIRINCDVVKCNDEANWKIPEKNLKPYGDYDYYSIMHYAAFMGSEQVIFPKKASVDPYAIGNSANLTPIDKKAVNYLYPARDEAPEPAEAVSSIAAAHSGKCLDIPYGNTRRGTKLIQYRCHGGVNQQFELRPIARETDRYQIVNKKSGKCLDIMRASRSDGAALLQWDCTGNANQQFKLRGSGKSVQIVAVHSDKCLTVANRSKSDRAALEQQSCDGSGSQTFRMSGR